MRSIVLAAALLASNANVDVHLAWPDAGAHPAASIHATRVDGDGESADFTETHMPLPPGQWFVTANALGYWSEPRLISAGAEPAEVTLTLEPATHIRARIKLPRNAKAGELTVHLQTIEPQPRARSIVCPITADRADCDAPAGKQDVVFRLPGYASLFRWNESLAGLRTDFGTLVFRRGSTFSGRVEMPAAKDAKVDVTLTPATVAMENETYRNRKEAARLVTHPNARGYFAFDVAPGRYVVRATSGDLASSEEEVNVLEGREAVLRDTLRLAPKRTLTINIRPAIDPWNRPWRVSVGKTSGDERTEIASAQGAAAFRDLLPGAYAVSVHRSDVDEWASAEINIVDDDATLDLPIEFTRVRGSVALGEQPLAALITFSDDRGMRLPVRSKADGTFLTLLPKIEKDRWPRVEIESVNPRIKRTLTDVKLDGADTPEAYVDLQLPRTSIEGIVVDAMGTPSQFALINVVGPDREFTQIEMADGHFSMNGAAPGRYKLTAMTREAESESALDVDLTEDAMKDVTLVVKPVTRLHGTIRSSFGAVINAGMFVTPAGVDPPVISLIPVRADGGYDVRLPPRTDEAIVAVAAPGFAFRMLRVPVVSTAADIAVDQLGGTLVIEIEKGNASIAHNGAALSANALTYLAGAHRLDKDTFEIPQIEAGPYSLCAGARCVSGTLARGGRLTLRLNDPAENRQELRLGLGQR